MTNRFGQTHVSEALKSSSAQLCVVFKPPEKIPELLIIAKPLEAQPLKGASGVLEKDRQ